MMESRSLVQYHLLSQQSIRSQSRKLLYSVMENYLIDHLLPSIEFEITTTSIPSPAASSYSASRSLASNIAPVEKQSIVYSMAVDQLNGRFLLCGDQQGIVRIYDLEKTISSDCLSHSRPVEEKRGSPKRMISPRVTIPTKNKSILSSVQWFPNDTGLFAVADYSGTTTIYDTNRAIALLDFQLDPFRRLFVHWCQFNPCPSLASTVIAALDDGTVRICDITSGDCVHTFRSHKMGCTMLDWHPFNEYEFVSSSKDGTVKTWDMRKIGDLPLLSLDWSHDHSYRLTKQDSANLPSYQRLAVTSLGRNNLTSKKFELSTNIQLAKAHESEVMSVRYSPCGKYILSSGNDIKLRLWSSFSGSLMTKDYSIGKRSALPYRMEFINFPFRNISSTSSFQSSSHDHLFLFPHHHKISVVPISSGSGNAQSELSGHFGSVMTAIYRPFKQQVISSGNDGLLLIWDHTQFQRQREMERDRQKERLSKVPLRLSFGPAALVSPSHESSATEQIVLDSTQYYSNQIAPARRSTFIAPIIRQYLLDANLTMMAPPTLEPSRNYWGLNSSSDSRNAAPPRMTKSSIEWGSIETFFEADEKEITIREKEEIVDSGEAAAPATRSRRKKEKNTRQDIEKALKRSRTKR